jgi:hypothetical protein
MRGSRVLIYIYSQKGLEKIAIFRGSKVIPKMKKGQKKCPFSENQKESWKSLFAEPLCSIMV